MAKVYDPWQPISFSPQVYAPAQPALPFGPWQWAGMTNPYQYLPAGAGKTETTIGGGGAGTTNWLWDNKNKTWAGPTYDKYGKYINPGEPFEWYRKNPATGKQERITSRMPDWRHPESGYSSKRSGGGTMEQRSPVKWEEIDIPGYGKVKARPLGGGIYEVNPGDYPAFGAWANQQAEDKKNNPNKPTATPTTSATDYGTPRWLAGMTNWRMD